MSVDILWERIQQRLTEMKLSPRAASLAAGLHEDAVRSIKNGKMPSAIRLAAIARALKCRPSDLLEGVADPLDTGESGQKVAIHVLPSILAQLRFSALRNHLSLEREISRRLVESFKISGVADQETITKAFDELLSREATNGQNPKRLAQHSPGEEGSNPSFVRRVVLEELNDTEYRDRQHLGDVTEMTAQALEDLEGRINQRFDSLIEQIKKLTSK